MGISEWTGQCTTPEFNHDTVIAQMMRSADQRAAVHAPLAVLPCPFPRSSFDQVRIGSGCLFTILGFLA